MELMFFIDVLAVQFYQNQQFIIISIIIIIIIIIIIQFFVFWRWSSHRGVLQDFQFSQNSWMCHKGCDDVCSGNSIKMWKSVFNSYSWKE